MSVAGPRQRERTSILSAYSATSATGMTGASVSRLSRREKTPTSSMSLVCLMTASTDLPRLLYPTMPALIVAMRVPFVGVACCRLSRLRRLFGPPLGLCVQKYCFFSALGCDLLLQVSGMYSYALLRP